MCLYTDLIHLNTIGDAFGSTSELKSPSCFFNMNLNGLKNIAVKIIY